MHTRTSLHRHRYEHVCTCNHSRWHTDLLLQGQAGGRGREACGYTASLPQPLRCTLNPPVRDSGDPAFEHSTASPSKKPMGLSKNQWENRAFWKDPKKANWT